MKVELAVPCRSGSAWKPEHHRDAEVAKRKLAKRSRSQRHWKTKMWKRRSQLRRQKAEALRRAREHPGLDAI